MIKPEHIPDEVAWKLHDKLWSVGGPSVDDVRAAIAAALNAWPGMSKVGEVYGLQQEWWLELPLPQEASDNDGQPDEVQEWNDYDPDC